MDDVRYLKKFEIVETETELPIQGQIRDPHDLYAFTQDLQSELVPKVIAVYLDDNQFFLGHQIFVGMTAETFDTQMLYHYYALFLAKRFILILNHPSGDATPTKADVKLLKSLEADSHVLSFKPFFADFIVLAEKHILVWQQTMERLVVVGINSILKYKITIFSGQNAPKFELFSPRLSRN